MAYADYTCNDADLCWAVYRRFVDEGFPVREIAVMDMVIRACVKPKFVLEPTLLAEHLAEVVQAKAGLLERCGMTDRDTLMSNDRFAEALRLLGVDPPTKISLVTGKQAFAFAKTDEAFMDLEEHENSDVQALVSARLGIKSTIEETRTGRLIAIANLTFPGNDLHLMPIPLKYSGAHTHRLSGDWKLNLQNLRRGGKLRHAIQAPPGFKVVAVDSSQVEARIASWLAGDDLMVGQFRDGVDVYSIFASAVFGYTVTKATHPIERFIGKTGVLGLQYGLGWEKFQRTVALASKAQVGQEVILSDEEAKKVIATYRSTYRRIPAMWRRLETLIHRMTLNDVRDTEGPLVFMHEKILLPSGLYLHYRDLENKDGQWMFTYGGKPKYLYGGKLLENITQALARIVVMDAAVEIRRKLRAMGLQERLWLNLQVHDELIYVVPDMLADSMQRMVMAEMCRRPAWGQTIPLAAEGAIGQSYGEAK